MGQRNLSRKNRLESEYMIDITYKKTTLRKAIAKAELYISKQETFDLIEQKKLVKGDLYEVSRVAGLFAAKRTADMIPDCHPMPVEYTGVRFDTQRDIHIISIYVEVHTIYKTGVEVEAMHAASVVALTMYDMLKPVDKGIEIRNIRLEKKEGGKSDKQKDFRGISAAVIVCSDSVSAGKSNDETGPVLDRFFKESLFISAGIFYVPDEMDEIRSQVLDLIQKNIRLILLTGGTGASYRDVTPEAVRPLLDLELPGVMEAYRQYGYQRFSKAMLSRGIAGLKGNSLIISIPGSPGGVQDAIHALFPTILHALDVRNGADHRQPSDNPET